MAYQMLEAQNQPLDFQILQTEILQEKLEEGGSQSNQNFFLDNNDGSKKRYWPKRQQKKQKLLIRQKVKARNFLSNMAYRRISREYFDKISFIIDVFTYLILDLKPFFLHATYSQ